MAKGFVYQDEKYIEWIYLCTSLLEFVSIYWLKRITQQHNYVFASHTDTDITCEEN